MKNRSQGYDVDRVKHRHRYKCCGHTIKLNCNRLYLNKEHCGKHRKCLKIMNSSFERSYIKTLKNVLRKLNFEEDKAEKVGTKN